MKNNTSFFRSKKFLLNLLLALACLTLILFGTLSWLKSYTGHASYIDVPAFEGIEVIQLDEFVKDKNVSYQIIDSIYDPKLKKGVVLQQDPGPGTKVKHNRKVYLYVTGMVAPQVPMPSLIDRSERQAKLMIETYGFKLGKVAEVAADCNGCVISQSSGGKEIPAGTPIKKGSVINLVVGRKSNFFNTSGEDSLEINTGNSAQTP
ncbi:MAG: PASTA domain-containing protein [Bacteroidia bacterium]|jgi:beta-lactam-binding protein with PASTA domain|nr:PASTA domain-containing protein [Bacteroidia bacterium]